MRADIEIAIFRQTFQSPNQLVFGTENILVVHFGAQAVLSERMTAGMLVTSMAYKQQFISAASSFVERTVEFRMLDLHLDRLADIACSEPEPVSQRPDTRSGPIAGAIEVRNVSFRYAAGKTIVFANISFHVAAGDYVAIAGPSGCGKTTLLKILLGLINPSEGEVLVDGVLLSMIDNEAYRKSIGVVMQDDGLLSGTIANNICFFDECLDIEQMSRCASLAGIHEDNMQMPMGYNSLIGDMGTSLSGGQRQRILLARALYRRPRILFMDEGTSNLDIETERRVSEAIRSLGLTRVIIAHRPETIATASRRLLMDHAGLHEYERSGLLDKPDQAAEIASTQSPS